MWHLLFSSAHSNGKDTQQIDTNYDKHVDIYT